ncbi:MAG: hypothetical protein KAX49_03965 [Halanaerobiales bacterium]|nr:hypothetical protein [Halanaerobiales bacterium]
MKKLSKGNLDLLFEMVKSELQSRTTKNVHVLNKGIYIPSKYAKLVYSQEKKAIVRQKEYNLTNQKFLYCDREFAYGILTFGRVKEINDEIMFQEGINLHKITEKHNFNYPFYVYEIKEVNNFKIPRNISLPDNIKNFIKSPLQYFTFEYEDSEKSTKVLPEEEYKKIVKDYKLKSLPKKYYSDQRNGIAFAQFHIRGVLPEDKEVFDKGKKSFQEIILGHSNHCDLRWILSGLKEKIFQGVIVDEDMKSYIRGMLGELNPKQAGPANVQKVLFLSKMKSGISEPERVIKKVEEPLINKEGAKIIDKYIMHSSSFWIAPGDVGATKFGYGYLGTIWTGKVSTGCERPDYHELFFYSDDKLPALNKKLFNGKFVIKAFKRPKGEPLYWFWESTAQPYPTNPYCHLDKGTHNIISEMKLDKFSKEEYEEWGSREAECK